MKRSSVVAIGGGIAAVVAIAAAVVAMSGVSDDQQPLDGMTDVTGGADVPMQEDKIQVLASFYPYYEFARNVAGDSATVAQYMPSGIEAHDWEPRPQEIQMLKDADVFVYNGLGMEPYIDNIMDSGEFDGVLFVTASDGIELIRSEKGHGGGDDDGEHAEEFAEEIEHVIEEVEHGHIDASGALADIEGILHEHEGDGHDHGSDTIERIEGIMHEIEDGHMDAEVGIEEIHHIVSDAKGDVHAADEDEGDEGDHHGHAHDYEFDPHIWLDPVLVKQQVDNIRDGLIEADPRNRMHYEQNAMAYNEKLDALDRKIESSLASCGKDTFVPFHNAFTYLGERYGLRVMALGGLSPDSEATAAELAEFVDFVRDNDIRVIFAEELVDPRLAEVIAEEAGADVMLFSPIEALTPEEAGAGVTYIDKMEHNLDGLKVALECQ